MSSPLLLSQQEYDIRYFDGSMSNDYKHVAGYDVYEDGNYYSYISDLFDSDMVANSSVLEICCAKGFVLKNLKLKGHTVTGVDWSEYAVQNCHQDIAANLILSNVISFLQSCQNNSFDYIVGSNCFCCFSDSDLAILISEINRVGLTNIFLFATNAPRKFYNTKTIEEWANLNWKQGTILHDGFVKIVK